MTDTPVRIGALPREEWTDGAREVFAGDALVGFLRFPRVGDIDRDCRVILGDVHCARGGKAGE